jgi:hypothetical protein
LPILTVVVPGGQLVHAFVVQPREYVPAGHRVQVGPPLPGTQTQAAELTEPPGDV